MTKEWAERMICDINAMQLLRKNQVEHVSMEEALPGNFVVLIYLAGEAEPYLAGDDWGTRAWLSTRNLTLDYGEITGAAAEAVAQSVLGFIPPTSFHDSTKERGDA